MAFVGGSSEEAAHLVWGEEGNHVGSGLEVEGDAFMWWVSITLSMTFLSTVSGT